MKKLKGYGWEVIFVTHKSKKSKAFKYGSDQFVMIYFNGVNVGLVQDFKIEAVGDLLNMSIRVPLLDESIFTASDERRLHKMEPKEEGDS